MTATFTPFELQNRFAQIQDLPAGFHAIPDTANRGWDVIFKISPTSNYTTIRRFSQEKAAKRKARQLNQVLAKE